MRFHRHTSSKCLGLLAAFVAFASAPSPSLGAHPLDSRRTPNARQSAVAGALTLSVSETAELDTQDSSLTLRLRGESSAPLSRAVAHADGEVFGDVALHSPTTFTVAFRGASEVTAVLAGLAIHIDLELAEDLGIATDAGVDSSVASDPNTETAETPTISPEPSRRATARLVVEPRLWSFRGQGPHAEAAVVPVFVGGEDPLRHRVTLHARGRGVTTNVEGAEITRLDKDDVAVDLSIETVSMLAASSTRIEFSTSDGLKSARLDARVVELGLTTQDATDAWPTPTCAASVWGCLQGGGSPPSLGLATCGRYYDVVRCLSVDACEVEGSEPFALSPSPLVDRLASARAGFEAQARQDTEWCSLTALETYALPDCLETPATIEDVVSQVFEAPSESNEVMSLGRLLAREDLSSTFFLGEACSYGGPRLFEEIDAHLGGGTVVAWAYRPLEPCRDCAAVRELLILFYPDARAVVVLEGGHGHLDP